tara:strand:- start:130 stop:810 length:681 start_codon:yes stop_codon:yes gene_type:complete
MKYPGLELENFDKAHIWRKYIYYIIKKYINGNILEVGAGIGSFTKLYENQHQNITLSESDKDFCDLLNDKFKNKNNIKITNQFIKEINQKFETIIYLNVLEHIEDDIAEVKMAYEKLEKNGHLIILVPAHQKIYSKFDKAVGHFRRYEINFFKDKLSMFNLIKLIQLDCCGYLLYHLNNLIFKKDVYPSKLKIFIWDKIFTPMTIVLDFLLNYKFGKNILCIIKKD